MNSQKKKLLEEMERKRFMSANNKFYQYTEEINGTEYTFQHPGHRMILRMTDNATIETKNGGEKRSREKLIEEMFKTIVVNPTVDFDYFDEHPDDFERVVEVASEFMGGDFRNIKKPEEQE